MDIVTLGIDLAKNIFALHGVDSDGKVVLQRPAVKRAKLLELTASLPPCLIGMEACSGAHHWVREMTRQGHDVRLIAPKFVAPYRMSGIKALSLSESTQTSSFEFVMGSRTCAALPTNA